MASSNFLRAWATANDRNLCGKVMLFGMAVRVDITPIAPQEYFRIPCATTKLVFAQYNWLVRVAACPIQPYKPYI